jgi:DNA-directed RNA polymerase subunit omega
MFPFLFSQDFSVCSIFLRRIMTAQLLEEASKKIPVPQVLINVVSRRVRQLSAGHRPLIETGPRMGFSDIALTEIIQGKLTYEDAPVEEKQPS